MMQQKVAIMQADTTITSTTTRQQSGPGDQAYWSTSLHSAGFLVLKGSIVFDVLVGGNVSDPAAFKTGLLNLAVSVAAKL
jgi:hypothetical protein